MAHRKTKYDIKSKLFLKDGFDEYNSWWCDWDYDDDFTYCDVYCDCYLCVPDEYEYLPESQQPKPTDYIYRRGKIHVSRGGYVSGKFVDMTTIYSKELQRQKKIDYLLGIDSWGVVKLPTIQDYVNYNSKNERN